MSVILIDLVFGLAVVMAGIVVGWYLRGGGPRLEEHGEAEEVQHAREVLAGLHELADGVAADVGAHTSRVEEINEELHASDTGGADAVVAAVNKLLAANEQMQQQLHTADEKLKEQAQQIEVHAAEARTDALTSLANRRAFDDEMAHRLAEFQRHGRAFSVVMFDVDHFKRFNDTHGHRAGDAVLRGLGEVLRNTARQMDVPARYGGEEFAVILPGTSATDANASAERLREAVEGTACHVEGTDLHVTVSIGVAEIRDGEDVAALIERADAALYGSKEAGRNCTHWHDGRTVRPVVTPEQPAAEQTDGEEETVEAPTSESEAPEPPCAESEPEQPPAKDPPAPETARDETAQPAVNPERTSDWTSFGKLLGKRLAEWKRGGALPGVVLVRVDDYPQIVAKHGKHVGNLVLRATIHFLGAALREMDLVAQHGVATYAALLPGTRIADLVGVTERLREAIAQCSLPLDNGRLQFTISVSGTTAIENEDTAQLLLRAVEALDAALQSGGNCCYFHNGQWSETAEAAMQHA